MEFLIVLAVLAVVVFIVTGPLRREYTGRPRAADEDPGSEDPGGSAEANEVAELEAAREAKYREIRDAELDHRTGKLSDADFEAVDSILRGEAVEILHRLDRVRGAEAPAPRDPDGARPNEGEQPTVP